MSNSTVVDLCNAHAALADVAEQQANIIVRLLSSANGTIEASVPAGTTLREALAQANLPYSDKLQYVATGGVYLQPEDKITANTTIATGRAGDNGR